MAAITITLSGIDAIPNVQKASAEKWETIAELRKILNGVANGSYPATVTVAATSTDLVRAAGTLTLSSGSGAVGGVINGTTVTATWATSDANSAALIAAAINANTTVNKLVSATSSGAVVTVTAHQPGAAGGAISFAATGTGVTASGSGKLAGAATGAGAEVAPTTYSLA